MRKSYSPIFLVNALFRKGFAQMSLVCSLKSLFAPNYCHQAVLNFIGSQSVVSVGSRTSRLRRLTLVAHIRERCPRCHRSTEAPLVKMAQNLRMQRSPITTCGQPINPAKSGFLDRSGFPIPTSSFVKYLWGSDRQHILSICWALTPCSGDDF